MTEPDDGIEEGELPWTPEDDNFYRSFVDRDEFEDVPIYE